MIQRFAVSACVLLASLPAAGQVMVLDKDEPDADRWNYPFSATPGTRDISPTFGAVLIDGFDDRDSQFLVGFDTSSGVPVGLDPSRYRVVSAVLTATVSNDMEFTYDPTPDAYVTFLDPGHPDYAADADAGRSVTVWGTDYRNGFDVTTWTETSAFGGVPVELPAQGARNAFAADFDAGGLGSGVDVSNNLKDAFDPTALGVGVTGAVAPGALVPGDTTFTFELDTCDAGNRAFLQQSLAAGTLNLSISSLQPAAGGPGGGEGVVYPVWYTRENVIAQLLGYAPTLYLEVRVGSPADLDGNGANEPDDITAFVNAFIAGDDLADIDGDCDKDPDDITAFVNAFLAG